MKAPASLALIVVAALAPTPLVAATQPLSIEEVLSVQLPAPFASPAFSPDGRYLAYVVTDSKRRRSKVDDQEMLRAGISWSGISSDIWIADRATGKSVNITRGGNNWSPSWSPDSRKLAFLADRSNGEKLGPARLWVWDSSSGQLRQISNADVCDPLLTGLNWTSDGRSLLITLFPGDIGPSAYADKLQSSWSKAGDVSPDQPTVRLFSFEPGAAKDAPSTDQINLDLWRRDLGLIDAESGTVTPVVAGKRLGHYIVSPDGHRIAYTIIGRQKQPGSGQYLYTLMVRDLASGEERQIAGEVPMTLYANSFSWSPRSDMIAYRTGGPLADDDINIVAVTGGDPRVVAHNKTTDTLQLEVDPPVWSADGRALFVTRSGSLWRAAVDGSGASELSKTSQGELAILASRHQQLFSADGGKSAIFGLFDPATKQAGFAGVDLASGKLLQVVRTNRRFGGYGGEPTVSPDGRSLAYISEDASHPPEIHLLDGPSLRSRQLSQLSAPMAAERLGSAKLIEWRTLEGQVQHGALIYPAGYVTGRHYPLIVKVYGGSEISKDLNRFGFANSPVENLQLFATRGYALLLADSNVNVGTPMVDLLKSVMPGIDRAIDSGIVDPDRIGLTGHSYGGYSALALITQSKRFKAAVMRAGMGDLISSYGHLAPDGTNYGLAWAESGQGRMGGSPWQYRDRYIENSPIHYLDRVTTPLLMIHGSEDTAVPAFLADQVFTGLRRLGKTVTYARYAGEDHWEGGWSFANQVDALQRTIDWFDRYLKPGAQAPGAASVPSP